MHCPLNQIMQFICVLRILVAVESDTGSIIWTVRAAGISLCHVQRTIKILHAVPA